MNDMNGSLIHALVLTAGEGSRLRKYARLKPLLQVADVPLFGRVLRGLKEAGIKNVYIVNLIEITGIYRGKTLNCQPPLLFINIRSSSLKQATIMKRR